MTTDNKPDPSAPDYDRIAAEMMQQWQQQFVKPEFTEALGKTGTMAQNMLEMGQVLWNSWLQAKPEENAAPQNEAPVAPDVTAGASAAKTAYAAADVDATLHKRNAAAAAAPVHDGGPAGAAPAAGVQPDTAPAASMASVALCAELARRLDLLSQRVWQLEQQLLNK